MAGDNNTYVEYLARTGYLARSIVYFALGGFALMALMPGGSGGTAGAPKDALAHLQSIPLGGTILLLTGIGLILFSVWRLIQSIKDVDHHGSDKKGMAVRTGLLISAFTHAALSLFAFRLSTSFGSSSSSGSGGSSSKQSWASWLMDFPAGEYILMLIGLIVFAFGVSQLYKAYTSGFTKYMSVRNHPWACHFSKAGLAARAVAFMIIAVFVVTAGWRSNAGQSMGIDQVWSFLSGQPFGQTLMVLLALGFICFGVYNVLEARYRRIEV